MSKPVKRRRAKPEALPPRTHEPAIEELITATQELLQMSRKAADGEYIRPWEHESLHKRVEAAIAAVRAPVAGTSKLRTFDDGCQLAGRTLREIERADDGNVFSYHAYWNSPNAPCRRVPQRNIVLECVQKAATPAALAGFCSIITDVLMEVYWTGGSCPAPIGRVPPPRELPHEFSDRAAGGTQA